MDNPHIDQIIQRISGLELICEQILGYFLKDKLSFRGLAGILAVFELSKLYFRMKKFRNSENLNKIFISEKTTAAPSDVSNGSSKNIFQEHDDSIDSIENNEDAKSKMKNLLTSLKKQCFKMHNYNHEYGEVLERSKKKINILSSLPIPNEMFQKNTEDEKIKKKVYYGEILYLLRPVIYNFLLIFKGNESFIPYLCSLLIDFVRLLMQRDIVFYSNIEKKEFIFRKKELVICYLLRNPFYSNIFKSKIIIPVLDKIIGKSKFASLIRMVIMYFIEFRCSLSLLM